MTVVRSVLIAATVASGPGAHVGCVAPERQWPCRTSWYDAGGAAGASGRLRTTDMYAASKTLPFGTRVRVAYDRRSVLVVVLDRGPYVVGRVLDISQRAATVLGILGVGVADATCVTNPTSPTPTRARSVGAGDMCSASVGVGDPTSGRSAFTYAPNASTSLRDVLTSALRPPCNSEGLSNR